MNLKKRIIRLFLLSIVALSFGACSKENSNNDTAPTGTVNFEMTDAPIDDANVQGVFVTVAAVKVDGKTISNFSGKTTIDLMAYQRGQVKSLGNANLESGTYNNVTLVLDNATDQSGNAPGCYVLTKSGEKKALSSAATTEITLTGQIKSTANQTSTAVMDFDLRKTVVYDGASSYKFATAGELSSGVRVVEKSSTGVIKGKTSGGIAASDKIVVYAYKKGTFNKMVEKQGQGSSNIEFKNAVTSCVVSNNTYELHFLESGEYELHFVSYKDSNNDGKLEAQGVFTATILGGLNISSLNVTANASVTADITLSTILPF